jgi:hypothetical protein
VEKGIITGAIAPVKAEPSGASEMISELLFGETIDVLETIKYWARVKNHFDQYEGWIDTRLFRNIPHSFTSAVDPLISYSRDLSLDYKYEGNLSKLYLPMGAQFPSELWKQDKDQSRLRLSIGQEQWEIQPSAIQSSNELKGSFLDLCLSYLNTPYRWGGRSNWGIDCSGLVQMVFRSIGIFLPRDAYQQYLFGEPITDSEENAMAFFQNEEGKIIHVGIVLAERKILHASGLVKIEDLTDSGIWDNRLGKESHRLAGYRRLLKKVI